MSASVRRVAVVLLLLLGVQWWLIVGRSQWGHLPHPAVWVAILILALVPPINRPVARLLDRLRSPSPRSRLIIAAVIAILSTGYLYFTAVRQERDFFLKIQDEHSYAIQARMLARGKLWLPAHPAADSFDSPYVFVRPVYASMYFPGTALALVPVVWVGLPWWIAPLLMSAAAVGVLYRVTAELIDGVAALLAAVLLVSLGIFRELALRLYSQVPFMLLGLCLVWAWLAWRNRHSAWRAALCGAIAAWMLIVRPIDAIAFIVPVALAMILDLRRCERSVIGRNLAAAAIAAMPFLTLQLIANRGIAGEWLTTPHAFYARRDFPGVTFGFHSPASVETLATRVPVKRKLYQDWAAPSIAAHRAASVLPDLYRKRLPLTAATTLPNHLLLILLPPALLSLSSRRWVVVAPVALFVLLYLFYLFYMAHYVAVIAPAAVFMVALGVRTIVETVPRWRAQVQVLLFGAVAAITISAVPQFDRLAYDDMRMPEANAIESMLQTLPKKPAIVLFAPEGANAFVDPVYNTTAASPDDAEIIRAHDLPGDMNRTLLNYYARHQPSRHAYRIVRPPAGSGEEPKLVDLGNVATLANSPL